MPIKTKTAIAPTAAQGKFLKKFRFIVRPDDRLTTLCHNKLL